MEMRHTTSIKWSDAHIPTYLGTFDKTNFPMYTFWFDCFAEQMTGESLLLSNSSCVAGGVSALHGKLVTFRIIIPQPSP